MRTTYGAFAERRIMYFGCQGVTTRSNFGDRAAGCVRSLDLSTAREKWCKPLRQRHRARWEWLGLVQRRFVHEGARRGRAGGLSSLLLTNLPESRHNRP